MDVLIIAANKFWAWLIYAFPMFFGVAISLKVGDKKIHELGAFEVASAFFFGVGISYFFSHFIAERWVISPLSFTFILMQVVFAAIGMSAMTQIIASVPIQITKILDALRTKFFGG